MVLLNVVGQKALRTCDAGCFDRVKSNFTTAADVNPCPGEESEKTSFSLYLRAMCSG